MLHNANIITRKHILFKRDSTVEVKYQIFFPGSFRIKVKSELCIKTEHIGQKLQIILIPDVIQRLILGIRDNTIVSFMGFVSTYGLLGLMTALPTTPSFIDYKAVYLPTNHFIQEEVMDTQR